MADYWKSNPRRMCDACKVWMADNKVSISMHEGGKKHKEAVQRRISEARKRGVEEIHEKDEIQRQLAAMEKAAFEAYKKDVQNDPMLAGTAPAVRQHYGVSRGRAGDGIGSSREVASDTVAGAAADEAKSEVAEELGDPAVNALWTAYSTEEGYVYYFNSSSGQTTWEKPLGYSSSAAPLVVPDSSAVGVGSNKSATIPPVSGVKEELPESVPVSQPTTFATDVTSNTFAAGSDSVRREESSKSVPVIQSESPTTGVTSNSASSSVSVKTEETPRPVPASRYGKWTVTLVKTEVSSSAPAGMDSVKRENSASSQQDDDDDGVGAGLTCRDDQDDENRFKFHEKTLPPVLAHPGSEATAPPAGAGMFKKRKRAGGRRGRADDD